MKSNTTKTLEKEPKDIISGSEIPKKIHYCWFGGNPLPKTALKCIKSWEKYLPDYEIIRWDESNFDVNQNPYISEAYKKKKYAFVSDFARFQVLYKEGGLYFDTDVELISSIDDIIASGPFMGCEHRSKKDVPPQDLGVAPGLGLGVSPRHPFYKEMIDLYSKEKFTKEDGSLNKETVVTYTTGMLCGKGLKNTPEIQEIEGIKIYPVEYFCPISTEDGKLRITEKTRSIHYYDQSWQSPVRKYGRKILLKIGGSKLKNILKPIFIQKN